ncbi:MAG: flagellar biosynthesis protein FlhB [Alphaproteobacteria bacterium]|nr:MAG: flagellar biosynthesis protein FlhB [Alphaproteobacteria bacterium]
MARGGDTGGEKSFAPTPKKLADARKRGEVAKSLDVSAAAAYLGLLVALIAFGAGMARQSGGALAVFLGRTDQLEGRILGPGGAGLSAALIGEAALGLAPLLILPFAAALAALLAQGAFVAAPEKLLPKASRVNPVTIAGNKFGPTGLFEFAKSVLKMAIVATVLWLYLSSRIDEIVGALRAPPGMLGPMMMRLGTGLLAAIAATATAIAAADYLWQRFDHARKLRMSFQEIRDETRESEGDPHQKASRRRRGEEIARNQMLAEVRTADVVIVNPTHYAVALKWTREPGSAPHCVAKGVDAMARAIREAAAAAGVPIHADPPTARALHALVEIGQEVPPEHYRAVAAAIRFAEAMRQRARDGWEAPS